VGEIAGALRRRSWIVGGLFTGVGEHLRHADAGRGSEHEGPVRPVLALTLNVTRPAFTVSRLRRSTLVAPRTEITGASPGRATPDPATPRRALAVATVPTPTETLRRISTNALAASAPGTAVATTHVHVERDSVPRAPAKSHSSPMLSVATCADFVVTMSLSPGSAQVKKCSARRWRVTTTLRQGPRRRGAKEKRRGAKRGSYAVGGMHPADPRSGRCAAHGVPRAREVSPPRPQGDGCIRPLYGVLLVMAAARGRTDRVA
jgi:hypothetical protein